MKLRALAILAVVLGAGVAGLWIWSGSGGDTPEPLPGPDVAEAASPSQPSPANNTPTPAVPGNVPIRTPEAAATPGGVQSVPPARVTSSVVPGMPIVRGGTKPAAPPVAAAPAQRPVVEPEGRVQLENVTFMLRDFRTRMGENPVGTNAEIMKAVMGGNPAKARLGPPDGQGLNDQGELVDRWGTAYFFHQVSKDKMEVRSAGPDQKLYTSDDIVAQ